jgi:hypothetical protein
MTSSEESGNGFVVDAKSIKISAVLVGIGGVICMAGAAVGAYAVYDAVSKWIDELEQPPSAYAMNTFAQAKAATTAGLRAWLDQQDQQQNSPLPQQLKKPATLRG